MLTEEALIVLAAFAACALLILGVLELLWPTRPKHLPRRPPAPPRAARPHRQSALVRHTRERGQPPYERRQAPLTPSPVPLAPLSPAVLPTAAIRPGAPVAAEPAEAPAVAPDAVAVEAPALAATALEVAAVDAAGVDAVAVDAVAPEPIELAEPEAIEAPAPVDMAPEAEVAREVEVPAGEESVVELCFALYQEQRYSDVVARGAEALTGSGASRLTEAQEQSALWSVVALAHQALGEETQSRTALENAIATAPDADRPTYQRQLASLAGAVARGLIAEAKRHAREDSEDCLGMLRSAVAWLDRGAEAAPDDRGLAELAEDAQGRLWPAWERTVLALVQRQDFRSARRLLREALADARFPAARADTFKELFSGTFSGEIGQLTAQAIRSMQEARESDALASLQRAESLLDTLNEEALPASRREEVDRRLWWGYNKLGTRRIEAGLYDDALEPLFHALGYDIGPARRQETVALLVRALDGIADTRALAVQELADRGDREAAFVQCDKLWALLRSATEMGLTQDDLVGVFGKAQRLFDSLGRSRS